MQSQVIYNIILFITGGLGLALIYAVITYTHQQQKYMLLQKEIKSTEIKTLEKERRRIALDLHDEITPVLSVIKMALSSIDNRGIDHQDLRWNGLPYDGIGIAMQYIDDAIRTLREIENNLMPQVLLRYGVSSAIEQFIVNIQGKAKTHFDFNCQDIPHLPDEISINLYRIIMEIIHNTLKHANASQLYINLETIQGSLVLTTIDNGTGFDLSKTSGTRHGIGLLSMQNRAEIMNGELQTKSNPGYGTKYIVKIPLK